MNKYLSAITNLVVFASIATIANSAEDELSAYSPQFHNRLKALEIIKNNFEGNNNIEELTNTALVLIKSDVENGLNPNNPIFTNRIESLSKVRTIFSQETNLEELAHATLKLLQTNPSEKSNRGCNKRKRQDKKLALTDTSNSRGDKNLPNPINHHANNTQKNAGRRLTKRRKLDLIKL